MGERGYEPPSGPEARWRWKTGPGTDTINVIARHRLGFLGLDARYLERLPVRRRMDLVHQQFLSRVPFENLSRRRVCLKHPDEPGQWPRATDRLLRDNQRAGLGGTSFSLAYALRDLLCGVGANAHCALGRNLVTEEAHAAVIAYDEAGDAWLYAPALLLEEPLPVRLGASCREPFGTVRFEAHVGASYVVSLTLNGSVRARPICSILPIPAPPHRFRQAWVASFRRGRARPLELACRVGGEIRRYRQRPCRLEIVSERGRERRPLEGAPVDELHELFGIDTQCLRDWFDAEARASD